MMNFIYKMYSSFQLNDRIIFHKRDIDLLEKRIKMHKNALKLLHNQNEDFNKTRKGI